VIFDPEERGPQDDDLKLIFEAVDRFTARRRRRPRQFSKGLVLQHQARRWAKAS
jgi:hypothetical protein